MEELTNTDLVALHQNLSTFAAHHKREGLQIGREEALVAIKEKIYAMPNDMIAGDEKFWNGYKKSLQELSDILIKRL